MPPRRIPPSFFTSFCPELAVHGPRAIEIRLPTYAHGRIHPVIHPMYLKLATTRSTQKGLKAVIDRHFDAAYPIESIIAHRNVDGKTEYLVQWEGCGLLQSTWEPEDGLAAAQRVRDRYWKRNSQRELTRPESAEQRETGVAELMAGAVSTVAAVSLARRLTGKQGGLHLDEARSAGMGRLSSRRWRAERR